MASNIQFMDASFSPQSHHNNLVKTTVFMTIQTMRTTKRMTKKLKDLAKARNADWTYFKMHSKMFLKI